MCTFFSECILEFCYEESVDKNKNNEKRNKVERWWSDSRS